MLSDRERDALGHMRAYAREAQAFVSGCTYESYREDRKTYLAVTRCLGIVSEAGRRLTPETRERLSQLPWRALMDAGNVYRHVYDQVAEHRVWGTVHEQLPAVIAMVNAELGPE